MPSAADALLRHVLDLHQRQPIPGGQLVVLHRGEVVLDEAFGVARGFRPEEGVPPEPMTRDRELLVFSAGKPVVGIAAALLATRGQLDLDAPVSSLWPEFAQHGKGDITVLDVLTHRAGVFAPELIRAPERWLDLDEVARRMAAVVPRYRRGTFAYMPYEFGWIVGELIRRVTGRDFGRFVAEEIAAPAGLSPFDFGVSAERASRAARAYWLGTRKTVVAGDDLAPHFEALNSRPEAMMAVVPGAGLTTTARALARFYQWILEGCPAAGGGAPLVAPEQLARTVGRNVAGFDRSNRVPLAVGRGFVVGTWWPSAYGPFGTSACFGHQGAFCSVGMVDADRQIVLALLTNGNHGLWPAHAFLGKAARLARAIGRG